MLFGEQVIEPETESRIGTCAECSVRDRDFSEKKLYKCETCDRWFCEKHVRPRTFLIRGVDDIQNLEIPEGLGLNDVPTERTPKQVTATQQMFLGDSVAWIRERVGDFKDRVKSRKGKQNKWKGEDSHPDFQFTKKWLGELGIDDRKRSIIIKRASIRMNRYKLAEKAEKFNLNKRSLLEEATSTEASKTERHFPTKEVVFLVALLALVIVFWFLSGWIYQL